MILRRVGILCALLLASVCSASAQNYLYATGSPVYSTSLPIDHGILNVNNGEIHLEIPLSTKQQRGNLVMNQRLIYDSRIWRIAQNNSGYLWQPNNVANSNGGWTFSSGAGPGNITYTTYYGSASVSYPCEMGTGATTQSYSNYASWSWTDPSGTVHQFPLASTVQYNPLNNPNCNANTSSSSSTASASDGSGYLLSLSNYTTASITDTQGRVYKPQVQSSGVMDSDGNYWSSDANGNLVDTSGQTLVQVSTSGSSTYYDVLGVNATRQRYTVTMAPVSYATAFNEQAVTDVSGSFNVITKITLPDNSSYSFTYDSGTSNNYGEMTSMTLPTGGVVTYGYSQFFDSYKNMNRWVTAIGKNGGTTTITPAVVSSCSSSAGCQETQTVHTPDGNETVYAFSLDKAGLIAGSSWVQGISSYQGTASSGTKLRATSTSFTYDTYPVDSYSTGTQIGTYTTPATRTDTVTLSDVGVSSQTTTTFFTSSPFPTEVKVWDFGVSVGGSPTTDTTYTYYGNTSYPTSVAMSDGSGNQISRVTYGYDETTPSSTSGLPNHTAGMHTNNRTSEHDWINTTGGTLDTYMTYDDAGALQTVAPAEGKTTYSYDTTDTFLQSIIAPTPSSGVSITSTTAHDSSSGAVTSTTDPNNQSVSFKSFDVFSRPQEVDNPDGGITDIAYTPTSVSVAAKNSSVGWTIKSYDSYGRVIRNNVATGVSSSPWYMQDTCYNGMGQVSFSSYRFQGQFSQSPICSGAGDAYTYDTLGRVTQVRHGDGTNILYSYTGRAIKITDENAISKITQQDSFGRVTAVCELSNNSSMPGSGAPGVCGTDAAGTGFLTTYSYSLSNHATTVTQGSQTRIFQTDSLGRNISTQEPEAGTTTWSYAYNSTGLLVTRSRPTANQTNASVLTTTKTQYDSLDRAISAIYSDNTPSRHFDYDTQGGWAKAQTNVVGRLQKASSAVAGNLAATIFSYDQMGRVAFTGQCQPSGCYNGAKDKYTPYTWDYAGNLLSAGDGAGTTVTLGYTPAEEVTGITSSLSDATHPSTLLSNVSNGPFGPTTFQYGNGLTGVRGFDGLGRLTGGWLCSGSSSQNCSGGTQLYSFSVTPNGNRVNQVCDSILGPCTNLGYDDFNRLTSRTTLNGNSLNSSWSYDRYGNRWSQGGGSVSYNTANNQEVGFSYDAAGNVTSDKTSSIGHTYTYDAEGNVTQVDGGSTATYYYDALNRRVRTVIGSSALEYVFDLANNRISTWNGSNGVLLEEETYWGSSPLDFNVNNALHFAHQDWLGTERLTTSYSGAQEGTYSSLPFGDGMSVNGSDPDPYHFATLDHDYESGQDHAQYRELSSAQGRWNSPDPYSGSYDWNDPRSLNRYAYVEDNPFSAIDHNGEWGYTIIINVFDHSGSNLFSGLASITDGLYATAALTLGISAAVAVAADLILGDLFKPEFHGTLRPRPQSPQSGTTTCNGPAQLTAVGPGQAQGDGALFSKYPGLTGGSIKGGTFGTVAVQKGFLGLSTRALRQYGTQIFISPNDQGLISSLGGPTGPLSVSDYGDGFIQNTAGVAFDLYRFPTTAAALGFGNQAANATITFPNASGGVCPANYSVIQ